MRKILLLSSLILCSNLTSQQATPQKNWVQIEEGKLLLRQGEIAKALNTFLTTRGQQQYYPEAEYWIGRVYQQDRNSDLAIRQYKKAIQLKRFFYDASEIYPSYYQLANLYRRSNQWNLFEQTLLEIVIEERYPDEKQLQQEARFVEQLKDQGLDLMLFAQNIKLYYSEQALSQLGFLYYSKGYYNSAINMLCYPIISFFNKAVDFIQQRSPNFIYPTKPEEDLIKIAPFQLFKRLEQDKKTLQLDFPSSYDQQGLKQSLASIRQVDRNYGIRAYGFILDYLIDDDQGRQFIVDHKIYKNLYYLAAALWASGFNDSAKDIWQTLSYHKEAKFWRDKSINQLRQPVLDLGPFF